MVFILVIFTLVIGLIIPVFGFNVSDGVIDKWNAGWDGFGGFKNLEDFCVMHYHQASDDLQSLCRKIIRLDWMRSASIWSGTTYVGLIAVYILASKFSGVNRNRVSWVFLLLVPTTTFIVAILIFTYGAIVIYALWRNKDGLFDHLFIGLISFTVIGASFKILLISLFGFDRRAEITQIGITLHRDKNAQLWNFVDNIANKIDSRKPDNLIVGLAPRFYATAANVTVPSEENKLTGETVYLSLPLMRLLNKNELAAVIGHELGHFSGKDIAYSLKFLPIYNLHRRSLQSLIVTNSFLMIPAILIMFTMSVIFRFNVLRINRLREYEADKSGCSASSNKAMALALAKHSVYASQWEQITAANVERLNSGKIVSNLSEVFEDSARYDVEHASLDELVKDILATKIAHPFDSHPSLSERYKNIGYDADSLTIKQLISIGNSSGELIGNSLEDHEEELTLLEHNNMINMGLVSPPKEKSKQRMSSLLNAIYSLAAAMIGADGNIDQREIKTAEAIGKKINKDFDEVEFRAICKNVSKIPKFEDIIGILVNAFDPEELKTIYNYLDKIANADDKVTREEKDLLVLARNRFNLDG